VDIKRFILLLLIVANSLVSFSQYEYFWERKFGVDGRDEARDLTETSDHGIILAGYTQYKFLFLLKIIFHLNPKSLCL
jgi:hypothetical protein